MEDFIKSMNKRARIIKEQYPALKMWSDMYAIISHQKFEEEHTFIREFIEPVNADKVVEIIKREFNVDVYSQLSQNSRFIFIDLNKNEFNIIDELEKRMDILGYYPSIYYGKTKHYKKLPKNVLNPNIVIQFEPKKDTKIDPSSVLYHLTPDFNWKKVRVFGLTPKTQSKISNHPGRIYLIDKLTRDNDFEDVALALWDNNKNKNIIENMELLKIDMGKLKNYKFYEDPNFFLGDAVYTYENIPSFAITHIKSILVNPNPEKYKE